jgi:spore coat protein CotH
VAAHNDGGTSWSSPVNITTAAAPPLRISEWMSANASTLPTRIRLDAARRFEGPDDIYDWLEIQNSTADPLDLGGYFLTDTAADLARWQFPPGTNIAPYSAIVLFASGLNITDRALDERQMLHTNFALSQDGEYLALVDPAGQVVHEISPSFAPQEIDVSHGFVGSASGQLNRPSPGAPNLAFGPIISNVSHREPDLPDGSLVVTARVLDSGNSVSEILLHYRPMFEAEQSVAMVDNGTQGDAIAGDGIFTATTPSGLVQPGEMLRYYITVSDARGVESRMPRFVTADASPEYFGMMREDSTIVTQLPVLHRFIEQPTRADTDRGTRASIWYKGEFYDNVFIRIRGGTARSWPKRSNKIEFNDGYHFQFDENFPRVDEFNLNTTFTDKSYVRAILAYELYRDAGAIAPITFALRVEQNGDFFSVAHFVEQPDRDYLRHNGLDPNGALYKARADRLNGLTGRAEGFFDKKTRHEEDASDLQALINGLALTGDELERFLFDHVNLPGQITLMASNLLLQNIDPTDKNYYIYRDTEGNQEWQMLPWDLDLVLGPNALNTDVIVAEDDSPPGNTSHPYLGTLAYPYHGRKNHLFDAIVKVPRTNEMFLRRVRTMMDEFLGSVNTPAEMRYFETRIRELVEILGPDVLLDKEQWGRNTHFSGRTYTLEEATDRIINEYLAPRRTHLYQTHSIERLLSTDINVLLPEFASGAEFFVPVDNNLGDSWTGRDVPPNHAAWQQGPLGVGFEEAPGRFADLIQTVVRPIDACATCTNVLVRVPFQVDTPETIDQLTLRMKYDDAFVAYINGVEVARSNVSVGNVGFDSRGSSRPNARAIEFENFNISELIPSLDLARDNVLAIRLLNSTPTSNDLLLSPELVEGNVPDESAVGIPNAQPAAPRIRFGSFDANPVGGNQDQEYVELQNLEEVAIDISGWKITGGIEHEFRGGTVIPAGESLYVTPDSRAFRARTDGPRGGMGLFVQDRYQGHLSNWGETLRLESRTAELVDTLITPAFPSDLQQFLQVSEVHYHPSESEELEFIELTNVMADVTAPPLDLTGVTLSDGPSEPFVFPAGTQLAPGATLVIAKSPQLLRQAFPSLDAGLVFGPFEGALSNNGESLKLDDPSGSTIVEFEYDDQAPWPTAADGRGSSLHRVPRQNAGFRAEDYRAERWYAATPSPGRIGVIDPVRADFNQDGQTNVADLDLICAALLAPSNDVRFDLDGDQSLDRDDYELMVRDVLRTRPGDANGDGIFNSRDLVLIFQRGEFEDNRSRNSVWSTGDWNCDGEFNTSDLEAAFRAGGYE